MELLGTRVPVDHGRLDLLANYLRRGPAAERDYGEKDITWQGTSGSQGNCERAFADETGTQEEWTRALNTAYAAARLALVSMGEHSLCLARLITDPELGVHGLLGAEVLSRSAIEVGARAAWLLDPAIGPRERVVRYFIEECDSAAEYDKLWALDEGIPRAESQRAVQAIAQACASLGLTVEREPKRWRYHVEGSGRPTATEVVTKLIALTGYRADKGIVYSLLSGATHGATHSLLRSYVRVGETTEGEAMTERMSIIVFLKQP